MRRKTTYALIIAIVFAYAIRELVIWLGQSWVVGSIVAIVALAAAFIILDRRSPSQ
jgi:hypothetical protein